MPHEALEYHKRLHCYTKTQNKEELRVILDYQMKPLSQNSKNNDSATYFPTTPS